MFNIFASTDEDEIKDQILVNSLFSSLIDDQFVRDIYKSYDGEKVIPIIFFTDLKREER